MTKRKNEITIRSSTAEYLTSTIRNFEIVQKEGTREVSRDVAHYNLQMIITIFKRYDLIDTK